MSPPSQHQSVQRRYTTERRILKIGETVDDPNEAKLGDARISSSEVAGRSKICRLGRLDQQMASRSPLVVGKNI